jgi:hypothetical protein
MTLDTFLAEGYTLRLVDMIEGGPLVAVTVDHITEPVINQGRFTVQLIVPDVAPIEHNEIKPTVLQVSAEYNAPIITAQNGAVFDATLYTVT